MEEEVREGFVEMEEEEASGVSLALGGVGAICFVPDWLPPILPDTTLLLLLLLVLLACLIVWGRRKDQRL